jgi:hypothetical protein
LNVVAPPVFCGSEAVLTVVPDELRYWTFQEPLPVPAYSTTSWTLGIANPLRSLPSLM